MVYRVDLESIDTSFHKPFHILSRQFAMRVCRITRCIDSCDHERIVPLKLGYHIA